MTQVANYHHLTSYMYHADIIAHLKIYVNENIILIEVSDC